MMFMQWTRAFRIAENTAWGGDSVEMVANGEPLVQPIDWNAGHVAGLYGGTRVATQRGWREAGRLKVGDKVLTVDEDWQEVRQLHPSVLWPGTFACPAALRPLHVPAGLFSNHITTTLLPEQCVMFEQELALEMFGAHSVMLPAALLEGFFGTERFIPRGELPTVNIIFDQEEVIISESGAMLRCPRQEPSWIISLEALLDEAHHDKGDPKAALPVLGADDARAFLKALETSRDMGTRPNVQAA